jgi:hypothetical protein
MTTHQDLIAAYLKSREPNEDTHNWAFDEVLALCEDNPLAAAELTLALIEACETEEQLAYVAAGPIEDLLHGAADVVLPIFDRACKESSKARRAMQILALDDVDDEAYPDWKSLLQRHGLWEVT